MLESDLLEKLKNRAEQEKENKWQNGWYYSYFEDFVAQEGTVFKSEELTDEEKTHVLDTLKISKNKKDRECFFNAQTLSMCDKTGAIKYYEGFTNNENIAILHGFNVLNGKVVDVTHKIDGKPTLGIFEAGKEYIGVQFDVRLCYERIRAGKDSTSFIDNWREDWPVLKEKWKQV
jgi:hypothetical protein